MHYKIIELGMQGDTCYYQVEGEKVLVAKITLVEAVKYVGAIIKPGDTETDIYESGNKAKHTYEQFMNRPAMNW